jgi:hypothetical protein
MGHIHLPQSLSQKDRQSFQALWHQNSLQNHDHDTKKPDRKAMKQSRTKTKVEFTDWRVKPATKDTLAKLAET